MLVKIQQVGSFLQSSIPRMSSNIYRTLKNKCTEIIGDVVKLYCPSTQWRGNVKGKFLFVKFSPFGLEIFQTFYTNTNYGSLIVVGYNKGFPTFQQLYLLLERKRE